MDALEFLRGDHDRIRRLCDQFKRATGVGLMAQKSAWLKGAKRVIGVDLQRYRLDMAKRAAGSEVIHLDDDPVERIRDLTDGRGADVCVDAVGMEADRSVFEKMTNVVHLQRGSIKALKMCASAVRRGGVISVVGVYGTSYDNFPLGQLFDKGVSVRMGQALVHKYIDELMGLIADRKIRADDIITHKLALSDGPHAYEIFNRKQDGCVKVVLRP